jgi:hypothetical protein
MHIIYRYQLTKKSKRKYKNGLSSWVVDSVNFLFSLQNTNMTKKMSKGLIYCDIFSFLMPVAIILVVFRFPEIIQAGCSNRYRSCAPPDSYN